MKKTTILIFFFTINILAYSQTYDLVVKNSGDSRASTIDSIGQTNINIELKHKGKWIHTDAPKTDIKEYKYGTIDKKDTKFKLGSTVVTKFKAAKMNAVSFNIAGTSPIVGVTYERLLSNKISFELGLGLPSIGVGLKYFPFEIKEQKLMFHTGFTVLYWNSGEGELTGGQGSIIYLPVGVSHYGKKGFNFGIDIGPGWQDSGPRFATEVIPYGNLKLGKRF